MVQYSPEAFGLGNPAIDPKLTYLLALKPAGRGAGLYVTVIVGFYHLIIQRLHSECLSHNVGQGYSLETPVFDTRKSFLLDQTNTSKIRCFMWVFAYNNK